MYIKYDIHIKRTRRKRWNETELSTSSDYYYHYQYYMMFVCFFFYYMLICRHDACLDSELLPMLANVVNAPIDICDLMCDLLFHFSQCLYYSTLYSCGADGFANEQKRTFINNQHNMEWKIREKKRYVCVYLYLYPVDILEWVRTISSKCVARVAMFEEWLHREHLSMHFTCHHHYYHYCIIIDRSACTHCKCMRILLHMIHSSHHVSHAHSYIYSTYTSVR